METIDLIAGLAWDPQIRGFLAVLTGVVVLMGSVWLILSTNSGTRMGTLLSGAAFFGWMAIMASVWWIYGIGYAGDRPVFELVEIAEGTDEEGHLAFAENDVAEQLLSEDLPTAQEILVAEAELLADEHPDLVQVSGDTFNIDVNGLANDGDIVLQEFATAWVEYGILSEDMLAADQTAGLDAVGIAELLASENERNTETTLSELAAVAPDLFDESREEYGPWRLLSTAQMGEAQASAIAFLLDSGAYDFGAQGEFKILDGFASGGKDGLPDDPSRWDRIYQQFRSAAQITHPTGYAIIQVQAVTEESLDNLPGQAPQRPVVDETQPVVTVVMIRNLGNLRQLPAFITIGSLLIFLAFCYMLHERDKVVMARRAEFAGAS